MASLTTVTVSNRTAGGCTITFNAAGIDIVAGQTKRLAALLNQLAYEENAGGLESQAATFTVVLPALS